jgi:hypothetical protein
VKALLFDCLVCSLPANLMAFGAGRSGDSVVSLNLTTRCSNCDNFRKPMLMGGSANVQINNRPALRVGDVDGKDRSCTACKWRGVGGAPGVLINWRGALRESDRVESSSCVGQLTGCSSSVLIGNFASSAAARPVFRLCYKLVDEKSGHPIPHVGYVIEGPIRITGRSNRYGEIVHHLVPEGHYTLTVVSEIE